MVKAAILRHPGQSLSVETIQLPSPGIKEVLIKISACGICRTDLHVIDGDLSPARLPLVLGHEIVGHVVQVGSDVNELKAGDRVGVPWLAKTCMSCPYCRQGKENLCDQAVFTGYTRDGGFAEYTLADARFCLPIPVSFSDTSAAPLLCAGLIGWRSLKMTEQAERIGIYGFGAAAHIITQVAKFQGRSVYAFTSPGDTKRQKFAMELGAQWSGGSDQAPPELLDAAIIFAPVGSLVPKALSDIRKGGSVVCGGIHMSDIPMFPYKLLWGERSVSSVANLTRADGIEFFDIATSTNIVSHVTEYDLEQANQAVIDVRQGKIHGAAVLVPGRIA